MLILYPNVITCCPRETDFAFQFKSWICLAFQLHSALLMLTKHNSTFFSHSLSCFTQTFVTLLKKRGYELFHVDFKWLKRFLSTIYILIHPGQSWQRWDTHKPLKFVQIFLFIHLLIITHDLNRQRANLLVNIVQFCTMFL